MNSLRTVLEQENLAPELINLVDKILEITILISQKISMGALGETLGVTSSENVQGEVQKKLDVIANNLFIQTLSSHESVRAIASEEEAHPILAKAGAQYLVAFDPLDGSSNIDINASVGTIFTILKARDDVPDASDEQFFQSGTQQLCAGYVLYGPYTTLTITTGKSIHEFTLDKISGEYVLSHANIVMPKGTSELAINMANFFYWPLAFQNHIKSLIAIKPDEPRFNMRWQGAMVADIHRILSRGGVFAYPTDCRFPEKPAKLRLLYEAFPMALLIEAAGGNAYGELSEILAMKVTHLHQRVPVIMGDSKLVLDCFAALTQETELN